MHEGPRTSLDVTHVLCKCPPNVSRQILIWLTDDDSSLFSLGLALITLSPILLMVMFAEL